MWGIRKVAICNKGLYWSRYMVPYVYLRIVSQLCLTTECEDTDDARVMLRTKMTIQRERFNKSISLCQCINKSISFKIS